MQAWHFITSRFFPITTGSAKTFVLLIHLCYVADNKVSGATWKITMELPVSVSAIRLSHMPAVSRRRNEIMDVANRCNSFSRMTATSGGSAGQSLSEEESEEGISLEDESRANGDLENRESQDFQNQRQEEQCITKCRTKKCGLGIILGIVLVIVVSVVIGVKFIGGTSRQEVDKPPKTGAPQMSMLGSHNSFQVAAQSPGDWENLEYLEGLGLRFFLKASNSTCPPGICRRCTKNVYKVTSPKIQVLKPCDQTQRLVNASCWHYNPGDRAVCYNFSATLSCFQRGCHHGPSCGELTKMADLNHYCNGGHAVFDNNNYHERKLNSTLKCNCPHGQAGDRCEIEASKEKVMCSCYKKRYQIQESQPEFKVNLCKDVPYSNTTKCLYSTETDNCYCVAVENNVFLSGTTTCDSNNSDRQEVQKQRHNEAERVSLERSLLFVQVVVSLKMAPNV